MNENTTNDFHMLEKELKGGKNINEGRNFSSKKEPRCRQCPDPPCCSCQLLPAGAANNMFPCECSPKGRERVLVVRFSLSLVNACSKSNGAEQALEREADVQLKNLMLRPQRNSPEKHPLSFYFLSDLDRLAGKMLRGPEQYPDSMPRYLRRVVLPPNPHLSHGSPASGKIQHNNNHKGKEKNLKYPQVTN